MANTTKSISREYVDGFALMPRYFYPTQASQSTLKQGAGTTVDASGHAGQFAAGERLAGLLHPDVEFKDRSEASAADTGKDIPVAVNPTIRIALNGAAAGCEYKAVFMSDDQTFTFTPQAGGYLGRVIHYDSRESLLTVQCEPGNHSWETWTSLADDAELDLPAQAGIVIVSTVDEWGIVHIDSDGNITQSETTASTTVTGDPISNTLTLVDPAAATTTGGCDQLDISSGTTGSCANLEDPDFPRNIKYNFTDGDTSISAGIVTVTGEDQNGDAATEVIDVTDGLDQVGDVAFATLTSVELTALSGNGAADTFEFGYGDKFGLPGNGDSLSITHLAVAGTEEAASATDTTNNTFTPTTSADGSRDILVTYELTPTYTGSTTVTTGPNGSTNFAVTDSDTDLCVYDAGDNAAVKNRLGATKTVSIKFIGIPV